MELPYLMWRHRSSSMTNIFFLLLVAMNISVKQASATNRFKNETDRSALLEFKHQVSDPYGVLSSWKNSLHHCQWHGVTCDPRHQRVIALNLPQKNLSGTVSPHVGNLSFMKFIDLGENQFHGEIPQEVAHLFRLRFLNLSGNILTGEIPINMSYCSELKTIKLSMNSLQGKIPTELGSLRKLEILYLFNNNLTGEIPSSIGNLSSLKVLSVGSNKLKGKLPNEIGFLTSLFLLGVSINKLSGMMPTSIYNISTIAVISASANFFQGSLPANIGLSLPNLQILYMGDNRFYGNIPNSITNASRLRVLDVGSNKFDGQVPTNLGDLPHLRVLNLEMNFFGSNSSGDLGFIVSLTNNSNLRGIALDYNNFGGEIPKVMANLSYQLTRILLDENQLSGTIPEGLGNLVNLYEFDASWNSLSGVIPSDFGKLQNLQFLGLEENRLSGEILSTLCNTTALFHLDLANNQFEGSNIFGNVLMNCQKLQYVDISQNNLKGAISPNFFYLHTSLMYLDLGENAFSGSLPLEIGKLVHLVSLNVAYNRLSGEILPSLVDCLDLQILSLRANYFSGTIPPKLASLNSIQELDLSSNNLTGQIPRDLEKLQFLRYLNLSFNDLEGEIPTSGSFGNASQVSFIGNKKLCGGIPELDFPPCPIIKGKNTAKVNVNIVLATVLPVLVLVLGTLSFYYVMHQKRHTRNTGFSMEATKVDKVLRLSYHELHRATSGFSTENLIGSGNFGFVYKGRLDQHSNKLVAVKVLDLQKNGASKSFKAECRALRNIRHRNIVSIVSYCSSIDFKGSEFKALVYEFMENGNLDLWLHSEIADQATRSTNLNLSHRLNIAIDVASALYYLHNNCETEIVHCDIKPSNILLDNDLVAYVGDFGLAMLLPRSVHISSEQGTSSTIAIKGSIGYAAPEYGMGHTASTQGDVYSYGVLLLEMITRRRPTDDMFMDSLDLRSYVNVALPDQVFKIVDPMLLSTGDENQESAGEEQTVNSEKNMECIISLLKIGLKCSAMLPNDRMHMNEVIRKLHLIKDAFLGARILKEDLGI